MPSRTLPQPWEGVKLAGGRRPPVARRSGSGPITELGIAPSPTSAADPGSVARARRLGRGEPARALLVHGGAEPGQQFERRARQARAPRAVTPGEGADRQIEDGPRRLEPRADLAEGREAGAHVGLGRIR